MRKLLRHPGLGRTRDKLLFALAYGAIIGAVLFANPFPGTSSAPAPLAAVQTTAP